MNEQAEKKPSRSEVRNDAARAALEPLAQGERPQAVTIAAIIALAMSVGILVLWVLGSQPISGSQSNQLFPKLVLSVTLLITAAGMWFARYWAVMGFQVVLVLLVLFFVLVLSGAVSVFAALFEIVVIVAAGVLFWHLVKSMARIQMPTPPSRDKQNAAKVGAAIDE